MNHPARHVEGVAKPGPQAGGANAPAPDHRIALEHNGLNPRPGRFASGDRSCRPAADY
jgi:hypothetical protein